MADQFIKDTAEDIKRKIKGGYIYGEVVDLTDDDVTLVAAFYAGKASAGEDFKNMFAEANKFIGW